MGKEKRLQAGEGAPHRCPAEAGPRRLFLIPPRLLLGPAGSSRGQQPPKPLRPRPGDASLRFARRSPASARGGAAQRRRRALPCTCLGGLGGRRGRREEGRDGGREEGGREGGSSVRGERLRLSAGRSRQLLPCCTAGGGGSQRGGSAPVPRDRRASRRGARSSAGKYSQRVALFSVSNFPFCFFFFFFGY